MGKIHKLKPSKTQAEQAVRTLLSWAGDDPDRQGLKDTPARVARSSATLEAAFERLARCGGPSMKPAATMKS